MSKIAQIQLPDPADQDPHPRLLVNGSGLHAGDHFTVLLPEGWVDLTFEIFWEITGPSCWYISTPGYGEICPVGLFVQI